MLEIWSLVSRPLQNPACSAGSSRSRIGRSLSLMMCSRILLRWEINTIVLLFLHSLTSPFLGSVRKVEFFQSAGHLFVFQILLQRCWITFAPDSSAYLISSAGISSWCTGIQSLCFYKWLKNLKLKFWMGVKGTYSNSNFAHYGYSFYYGVNWKFA